ncbi:hypothetical protein [uncultured Lamprocystis sp.]|uniref:hypothetical protein n=1 Tax=uncultured Lamprocystis sp. TaxID=543132 RepID=UPI0025ECF9BC|nr:hypothetical protein [uncultured Lamprocystis sp.]
MDKRSASTVSLATSSLPAATTQIWNCWHRGTTVVSGTDYPRQSPRDPPGQPVEGQIDDRRGEQGQGLTQQQAPASVGS